MATQAATNTTTLKTLRFEDGAVQFRQRLVISILSHRPCLIQNIRHEHVTAPGLRRHEVSFLRLLDSVTNGTRIEINATGTQVRFSPGILTGGSFQHECPVISQQEDEDEGPYDDEDEQNDHAIMPSCKSRSIGWFLEGILPLSPFGKEPLNIEFTGGITDGTCHLDPSCDYLQSSVLPLMAKFGIGSATKSDGINKSESSNEMADMLDASRPSIRIVQRAGAPYGTAGRVQFSCPICVKELHCLDWMDAGKISRIRGTAISCQLTSSSATARVAYCAKGVLLRILPDVWIHTNASRLKHNKNEINNHETSNPSVSLVLTAQSTTGVILTSEVCLPPAKPVRKGDSSNSSNQDSNEQRRESFEDLGTRGAVTLLEEIKRGGCIDTSCQSLCFIWMALSPEYNVSRVRVGTLSQYAIQTLRLIKLALGVEFKIKPDYETKTVLLSCLGVGYRNMARAST
jgi:RNA 3'-terminal phosphate cyclase-like protein